MKTLLAALGLAALAAGCDERKDIEKARCTIDGVEARAVYHQVVGDDYMTLDLYKNNAIISSIHTKKAWLQCDDGRVLNFEYKNIVGAQKAEQ
ncbi:MAG: hypothetical protein PHO02_00780 [Candidatus Nanoarchaeia archaeon]|nr:hypothetical protein [Candidatus Nanoarchaeia archaeon]